MSLYKFGELTEMSSPIENRMTLELQKQIADEIDKEIIRQMFMLSPRGKMKSCLEKYNSDFDNCNLKEYKEVKKL